MLFGSKDEISEEWLKALCTKYECWSYEKEWKIFYEEPNKAYAYSIEGLKSVYFGLATNPPNIEMVCLALQRQSQNIKFYKAYKEKSKYALWFEEFTYMPHTKVKK